MWLGSLHHKIKYRCIFFSSPRRLTDSLPYSWMQKVESDMSSIFKLPNWLIALVFIVILIFFYPAPW